MVHEPVRTSEEAAQIRGVSLASGAKAMLIVKNSRIVVVGASDTSISFIEALLSINYLNFTNIVLIAPGGLPHNHFIDKKENLKAYSTSYTREELKKLMLESRVRVINARMVDIDRSDKNIILNDDSIIPYDTLVMGMGI